MHCSQQINSKRASKRYSTFSASPSFATVDILESSCSDTKHPAGSLNVTAASGMAEIKQITRDLEKLENKQLAQQRYVPTQKKTDELSTLNLGAKLERSLGRRMQGQDAVFTNKSKRFSILGEKKMTQVLSEKS
jgi:hypothetical protein